VNVDDGVAAVYNWIEAGANDLGIAVFGRAGAGRGGVVPVPPRLESLEMWLMKPPKFSLDPFHV
jgi:hypothetical protein